MAKNHRLIYEEVLKVKLSSRSSIHHIDGRHINNNFNNMVAIPYELHERYNITVNKFPKSVQHLLHYGKFNLLKNKMITEFESYLKNYKDILLFIEIRDYIKCHGLEEAKKIWPKEISILYENTKKN